MTAAPVPHAEVPKVLNPAKGIWVRQEIDNMGWIDCGDHLVVVDTLEKPELRDEVFEAIASTTGGKPVGCVINTHTHHDHVALNQAFVDRWQCDIVNARTQDIPEDGLRLGDGENSILIMPFPGCHTSEDIVVWVEDASTMFIGDLFGWGLIPWDAPLNREKADEIVEAYEAIIQSEAAVIVPGHGPLCSAATLDRWVDYFMDLVDAAKALKSAGESRAGIEESIPPPEDMREWWRFLQWKHADSVKKVAAAVMGNRI